MASERWGPARMGCDQRTLHDEAEEKQQRRKASTSAGTKGRPTPAVKTKAA